MYQLPYELEEKTVEYALSEYVTQSLKLYLSELFDDFSLFQKNVEFLVDGALRIDPVRLQDCINLNLSDSGAWVHHPFVIDFYHKLRESSPIKDSITGANICQEEFVCRLIYRIVETVNSKQPESLTILEEWLLQILLCNLDIIPETLPPIPADSFLHTCEGANFATTEGFERYQKEKHELIYAVQKPAHYVRECMDDYRSNLLFRPEACMLNDLPFLEVCIHSCLCGNLEYSEMEECFKRIDISAPDYISSTSCFLANTKNLDVSTLDWLKDYFGRSDTFQFWNELEQGFLSVPVERFFPVKKGLF